MDLEITKPFYLAMNIVECEMERLPSIKVASTVELSHPTGKLEYSVSDLWFECSEWDGFVSELRKLTSASVSAKTSLSSMSNQFHFVIGLSEDKRQCDVTLSLTEKGSDFDELSICFQTSLALDEVGYVADGFSGLSFW